MNKEIQLFNNSVQIIDKHYYKFNNSELLNLYGLYKQITMGNNTTKFPIHSSLRTKVKWESWTDERDKDKDTAVKDYIDFTNFLVLKYKILKLSCREKIQK